MRRLVIATTAALALTASVAQAGGVKETMVAPTEVMHAAASSSGAGLIVPLLILIVVVALVSSNSGGGGVAQVLQ